MPVYEYVCASCEGRTDRVLPPSERDAPGPCPACDAPDLQRRFSRVAVKLEGWGFARNDAMIPDRPGGRADFSTIRERAERLSDTGE